MGTSTPKPAQFHMMRVGRQQPNVDAQNRPFDQRSFALPFDHRYPYGLSMAMHPGAPTIPAQAFQASTQPEGSSSRSSQINPQSQSQPSLSARDQINTQSPRPLAGSGKVTNPSKRSSSKNAPFIVNTPKTMRHRQSADSVIIKPMKRRRLQELDESLNPSKKQVFRPSRPVANAEQIHHDVWRGVFRYCTPKDLLQARTLSKQFKSLLEEDSIWKDSRENQFGPDMAPCPSAITEIQYAELLVGKGCQNSRCDKQRTAKVYWTFMVRLCVDCLQQKTISGQALANMPLPTLDIPEDIEMEFIGERGHVQLSPSATWLTALPSATARYGRYDCCRWPEVRRRNAFVQQFSGHLFSKRDHESLMREYTSKQGAPADEIHKWIREKFIATKEHLVQVAAIENWERFGRFIRPPSTRADREIFFKEKAAELQPPISPSVLEHMIAYCKALDTSNAPSERSWEMLRGKIIPYRAQAEKVHDYCRSLIIGCTPTLSASLQLFKDLQSYRAGRKKVEDFYLLPEQTYVIDLAKDTFQSCVTDAVGDADLVLECLKRTYEAFQSAGDVPNGWNYEGTKKQYKLSMDDVRMVLEEVIQRQVEPHTPRGARVFDHFRCAGCTRADCKRFTLDKLFEHIAQTHATVVGEGSEFDHFARPFPRPFDGPQRENFAWYTIAWPRNLPVLPYHQKSSGRAWRADDEMEFRPQQKVPTLSAFAGRYAKGVDGIAATDFTGNLAYAAGIMKEAPRVDALHVSKIVLKYALIRWRECCEASPALHQFMAAVSEIKKANPSLPMKFRCATCLRQDTVHKSARQVKYQLAIEALCEHFRSSHLEDDDIGDWMTNLMALPSDDEVWHAMVMADGQLREEKDKLSILRDTPNVKHRRRLPPKAKVVEDTEYALDVFERLFPLQQAGQAQ